MDFVVAGHVAVVFVASHSDNSIYKYEMPLKYGSETNSKGRPKRDALNGLQRLEVMFREKRYSCCSVTALRKIGDTLLVESHSVDVLVR